jgi:hypothetical protein
LISAHAEEDFTDLIEASPAVGFLVKQALSASAVENLLRPLGDARDRTGQPGTPRAS